jgi:pimeloyl-ACP methyl ester carboxylesterase
VTGSPAEPWSHRFVSANGARFHVAEVPPTRAAGRTGRQPLVLFLHGFPQAWWTWRHQLPVVARAGFPVAAMDLRGYGGSDKPPRGYDPMTLAADVAGVIGSLGHRAAVLVGQGWGGYVGWTAAVAHAERVDALAAISAPHPRAMLRGPLGPRRKALVHVLAMQSPWLPERRIQQESYLASHLSAWSSPGSDFPTAADVERSREAVAEWPAPHCVLEYHRWLLRSRFRADGHAFAELMRHPVTAPVLMITGADDPAIDSSTVAASGRYVHGRLAESVIEAAGHFPHEEQPDLLSAALLTWLSDRAAPGVDLAG